ncbi:MAG TPA: MgtC/SapB family protein [Asticcacaulis sp.]|nr:MgtC/SapB family protein [Asticcacaulis sp.]
MPLHPTWQDIALRLALCVLAGAVIGLNRDAGGKPVGMRTSILICLAAGMAMMQANLLLDVTGKTPSSFPVLDLMRLPLGILSGIGFIGAGVIIQRRNGGVRGITTAASLWFVTVDGLALGGGQLGLGVAALVIAIMVLWLFKPLERCVPREHVGRLHLDLRAPGLEADQLRQAARGLQVRLDAVTRDANGEATQIDCEVRWRGRDHVTDAPDAVRRLMSLPQVAAARWTLEDYR